VDLPAGVCTTNDTVPGETSNGISKLICAAVTALIGPDVPFTRTETPVVDEPKFAPKTDANVPGLRRPSEVNEFETPWIEGVWANIKPENEIRATARHIRRNIRP
jgi:hypothetical protein